MSGKVFSWRQAIENGYEPRQYEYLPGQFPNESFIAVLDFKIWAKKVAAIDGYFTILETGRKILLSVYLSRTSTYKIGKNSIDFYSCPAGGSFRLLVQLNGKGKPVLVDLENV